MRKIKIKIIPIFIIVVVALYVVIYVLPKLTGFFDEKYSAEYGDFSVCDETEGYLVKSETVYGATYSGTLERLEKEGSLIRVGTSPVNVVEAAPIEMPSDISELKDKLGQNISVVDGYWVKEGGIVSYFIDGYENSLTFEKASQEGIDYFEDITQKDVIEMPSEYTYIDYPVFKIVDPTIWHLVAFIPKEHLQRYEVWQDVEVLFDVEEDAANMNVLQMDNRSVDMYVIGIEDQGDVGKLILESDKYYDGLGKSRVSNVRIATVNRRGLLIEKGSITEKDSVTGVYVVDKKGEYYFMPVKVLATDGEIVVVEASSFEDEEGNIVDTIDPFDEILRNPNVEEKSDDQGAN